MEKTKELQQFLNVIQKKQKQSQIMKREMIRKMATKRMLLDESKKILEIDLKNSLKQDLKKKQKIQRNTSKDKTVEEENQVQLFDCRGWHIHNQRIWIQAKANVLNTKNIKRVYLACIPDEDVPEIVWFNQQQNPIEETMDLFITFQQQYQDTPSHHIYCIYQTDDSTNFSSIPTKISQWYNEQDTAWFDQIEGSFSLSNHVMSLYFPFCTCIEHDILKHCDILAAFKPLKKDQVYISKDHLLLTHLKNKNMTYLYGLNESVVVAYISQLSQQSSNINIIRSSFNITDIISLLGQKTAHIPLSIALSQQQL